MGSRQQQFMSLLSDIDPSRGQIEPMDVVSETSNHTWLQDGFETMQLKRSQMNELIMEYLVHEGFKEAAERFREEAGIEPSNLDLKPIETNNSNNHTSASNNHPNSDNIPSDANGSQSNTRLKNGQGPLIASKLKSLYRHEPENAWLHRLPKKETIEMIDKRIEVKESINQGDILKAQSLINLYYPELLDRHEDIYHKLQNQHLIELIRQQKINDVLAYIHGPLDADVRGDLEDLEKTLALLAYDNPDKSPYANLMDLSQRAQLASDINDLILQETLAVVEVSKPKLVTLIKLLFWTQSELEKKKIQFPKMTDLVNGTILEPRHWR